MSTPAGDGLVGDATIRVDGDTDPAVRALQQFSRTAQRRIRDVRDQFVNRADDIRRALTTATPALRVDTDPALRQIGQFTRDARNNLRDLGRRIARDPLTPTVNTDPAIRRLDQFSRDAQGRLRNAQGRFVRDGDDLGRGLGEGLLSGAFRTVRSGIGNMLQSALSGLQGVTSSISSNPWVGAIGAALAAGVVVTAAPLIGALLSAAVISVSGLGIIGLGAAILKNEPEVKKAATRLMDTVQGIFERAAEPLKKPLVDAIKSVEQTAKDVAPQIEQVFATVAESGALKNLTDGFDRLIKNALPGFNDMLTRMQPVFEGIEVLMGRVGTGLGIFFRQVGEGAPGAGKALQDIGTLILVFLATAGTIIGKLSQAYEHVRTFVSNVVESFQWLYDRLVGNSIVPDLINEVVAWFAGLPGRAASALASLTGRIGERARAAGAELVSTVRTKVAEAVAWVKGLPGRAFAALSTLSSNLRGRARDAGAALVTAIREKLSDAVEWVEGLPGRASAALSNIGGSLYSSGRSMIQGLIDGILSKLGDAVAAAQRVVSAVRDFFPGSPAKEGPFSGKGWTLFSGRAISESLAEGIVQRQRDAERAARMLAQMAQAPVSMSVTPRVADLGVSAVRVPARATVNVTYNVSFTNAGAIGSQFELRDWFTRMLSDTARTGRLPAELRAV